MTKKDYELIGRAIIKAQEKVASYSDFQGVMCAEEREVWRALGDTLAEAFVKDNSNFDKRKWLEYLGL